MDQERKCGKCGGVEFYDCRACKACAKARAAARRVNHPEEVASCMREYQKKNASAVNAKNARWAKANPEKVRAKNAKWHDENRDKVRAKTQRRRKENPEWARLQVQNRRARLAGGVLSKGLAERLFKLQRGLCACCQLPLGSNYHLDHIMPLALGGSNTDGNMQLLRQRCNTQKSAKHPVEFMQERGFLL